MAVNINPTQAYAYAETLEILSLMEKAYVEKIPQNVIKVFEIEADKDYVSHIDASIPLENQKLSRQTNVILTMLSLDYWCNPEEKAQLQKILNKNEQIHQEELRKKYNYENLFNNNSASQNSTSEKSNTETPTINISDIETNSNNLPMDYSSFPWYKKIFTNIKNFIYKLFNKKK